MFPPLLEEKYDDVRNTLFTLFLCDYDLNNSKNKPYVFSFKSLDCKRKLLIEWVNILAMEKKKKNLQKAYNIFIIFL